MRRFVWTLVPSVLALAACTAGSQEGTTLGPKQQYEVPPLFRDDPGSTYQPPPSTYQPPPGGPQSPNGCLACGHFRCTGSIDGQSIDVVISLEPIAGGTCESKGTVFACDGTLIDTTIGDGGSELVGTWTKAGGGFVVTQGGFSIDCQPTTAPVEPQPTPQPGAGGFDAG